MLTRITIRNFKQFRDVSFELGNPVVLVGPNDSGKTSALQALLLWEVGLRKFLEKRGGKGSPERRPGVAINRRDLAGIPAPSARMLWHDLHVRNTWRDETNKQRTDNVRIEVILEGVTNGAQWTCGLEFDFANPESFYCRPTLAAGTDQRLEIPAEARKVQVAFLAPMSGIAANETKLEPGAISVRIGEGRTAEVLRNLCHQILEKPDGLDRWDRLTERIQRLFGVRLDRPELIIERGEVDMTYRTRTGTCLDLSSAGRGLQQTLLLLSFLSLNPGSVVLLDEPDAHLEILRQRETYQLLADTAAGEGSQVIVASHSEVILNEAADRDVVVAFVGSPHRIDDRGSQVLKSLKEIGFEHYYQAEQTGWVLYLEGATDLAILRAFAERLRHPAAATLERPFVHYVANQPSKAQSHFHGLREAKPGLLGAALFDRLEAVPVDPYLQMRMLQRREIENYLCQQRTLESFAFKHGKDAPPGSLFEEMEKEQGSRRTEVMRSCIKDLVPPVALRDPADPWWTETKASDDFLDRLFEEFYRRLDQPNLMRKTDYHALAVYVDVADIDPEISEVLDWIQSVHEQARKHGTT